MFFHPNIQNLAFETSLGVKSAHQISEAFTETFSHEVIELVKKAEEIQPGKLLEPIFIPAIVVNGNDSFNPVILIIAKRIEVGLEVSCQTTLYLDDMIRKDSLPIDLLERLIEECMLQENYVYKGPDGDLYLFGTEVPSVNTE